ncbi:MAG: hypothetical protein RL204_55 [Bacteroidota bacterium]|jgi:hypothetical protein
MKTKFLIFSIIVVLFACSKEKSIDTNSTINEIGQTKSASGNVTFEDWFEENKSRLNDVTWQEVVAFSDIDIQREIFRCVPTATKVNIWKGKYDAFLNIPDLSSDQRNFIIELNNTLSVQMFETSDRNALHTQLETIRSRGAVLFDEDNLFRLLADLNNPASLSNGGSPTRGGGLACTCSKTSDWCSGGGVQIDASCSAECSDGKTGCGTLFLYDCNGRCKLN